MIKKKSWTKNQDVLIKPCGYIYIHLQIIAKSIFGGILKIHPTRSFIHALRGTNCWIKASSRVLLNGTSGSCHVCDRNRTRFETAQRKCRNCRSFGTNIPGNFEGRVWKVGKMRGISCVLPEKKQAFLVTPKTCYNFKKMKFTTVVFWWKQFGKVVFWSNEIGSCFLI